MFIKRLFLVQQLKSALADQAVKKSDYFGLYILWFQSLLIMELWGIAFYAVALYIVFLRYLCGRHYNYSRTLFISPSTCCLIILCAKSFYAYTSVYLICAGIFYLIPAWTNVENECCSNFWVEVILHISWGWV